MEFYVQSTTVSMKQDQQNKIERHKMVEAKLLRKKLKNGLVVEKWDLVSIIEKQQEEIQALKDELHKYKPQIWEVMKAVQEQ
jgi:hypothetical protein